MAHQSSKGKKGEEKPSGRNSPDGYRPNMDLPLRMVLMGKTGSGKSSSGNTIFGEKVFRAAKSGSSVTKECWKETREVAGRQITIVDTPGLFDTGQPENELMREISKCINMTTPGPHAIILVLHLGPFGKEERQSVKKIKAMFGEEADKYTLILFTHGDELVETVEEYLSDADDDLKDLVSRCGDRYHVFNNTEMQKRRQVVEFLEKVDDMVSANNGKYFTDQMYKDVEDFLKKKEEELREFYKQKLQEKEKKIKSKFDDEMRKLQNMIDELKESNKEKEKKIKELKCLERQNEIKLQEYKRFYEAKLRAVRQEAEQTQTLEGVIKPILEMLQLTRLIPVKSM